MAKKRAAPRRPPAPDNAWDRQEGESAQAFAAFREYLMMGPDRSLAKVGRRLGKSKALMDRWSARWNWVGRVDSFTAEVARRQDEEAIDELAARGERMAALSQTALEAMAAPSIELVRRLGTNEGKAALGKLSMEELIPLAATTARAIPRVVQTERLVRGQSTSNVGGHRGGPLELEDKTRKTAEERVREMSDEALDNFLLGAAAQRKASERSGAKA